MPFVLKDAYVQIDGNDLTTDGASVEVSMAAEDIDVSTFGGGGVRQHLGGLRSDQFVITFLSNFDTSRVHDTLFPLLATADQTPEFRTVVSPFGPIFGPDNPGFLSNRCILLNYTPLAGDIGARSEMSVTIPSNEPISTDTT
jgi:hypothetical protein